MQDIKRYPLLRQEAFNDENQDLNESEVETFIPLDYSKRIYMIHPDLICIFNTISPDESKDATADDKTHKSAEDASTPGRPLVLGGSFLFSNSCDGYISPTLIEKYESLVTDRSLDKENLSNNEDCYDEGSLTEDVGANQDIISFAADPSCIESSVDMELADKPAEIETADLTSPYVSPHKKDVITFFLTEMGRQKTLEEEDGAGSEEYVPTETVGETTPDCNTSDGSNKENESNNKDIISFLQTETKTETPRKLSYSLSVPPPRSQSDFRKPYISLNFSDIISFYNSEESLLQAYDTEPVIPEEEQCPDAAEFDDEELKSPKDEDTSVNNPDQFVFEHDRSVSASTVPASTIATSTPKHSSGKRKTPLMIHQGSVISFYSSEESFLEALEVSDVEASDTEDPHEIPRTDDVIHIDLPDNHCEDGAIDTQETSNSDIKVFSNRSDLPDIPNQSLGTVPSHSQSQPELRKSNSVLVVTEEFPDIISFYNPGVDVSAVTKQEIEDSIRRREDSASVDTVEFGTIELPKSSDGVSGLDKEVATAPDQEPFVVVNDSIEEDSESEANPDKFVFRNDRSKASEKQISTTSKLKGQIGERHTPMMVHQGSVITFYCNESSFLAAKDSSQQDSSSEAAEGDIDGMIVDVSEDDIERSDSSENAENFDIKVYSNTVLDSDEIVNSYRGTNEEIQPEISDIPILDDAQIDEGQIDEGQIDQARIEETQSEETQSEEGQSEESQSEEGQSERAEIVDAQFYAAQREISQIEKTRIVKTRIVELEANILGAKVVESQIEEAQIEEPQIEEPQVEEAQIFGDHIEDAQIEETKIEEAHIVEAQTEEAQIEEPQIQKPQTEKAQIEEAHIDEAHIEEAHIEEVQIEQAQIEVVQIVEAQIEEAIVKPIAEEILEDILEEPEVLEKRKKEDKDQLVHIVDMNFRDSEDDMPGLESIPDSIHESDESERQDSLVVVEDSFSEDGRSIRKVQDIENLPSIERAIDMIDAIGGDMEVIDDLGIDLPEPLDEDFLYDDDEFERDITEEIDSLISEAELLMAANEPGDDNNLLDDLDNFFDEVDNPEELLLKAEPDEVPQLQMRNVSQNGDLEVSPRDSSSESAIINFITDNMDKYMEHTDFSFIAPPPHDTTAASQAADDEISEIEEVLAGIDELLDVDDDPDVPGCETPEPPYPFRDTPTPQPTTPTVTRRLLRTTSFDVDDGDSDEEYDTLYEALNKPLLPPIPRVVCEDEDDIRPARSLTSFSDYTPQGTNKTSHLINSKSCDYDSDGMVLSTGLLSEIVQHPLAGQRGSLKRSASSGDRPGRQSAYAGLHGPQLTPSSFNNDPIIEAQLFFLQNNIGGSTRELHVEERNDKSEDEQLSPLSSLAQTISERLSAHHGAGRPGNRTVKPSDVVKIDKQIFGELQKKFSKPKDKMSSLRSKYKNRTKATNKWVPVQVIPDQVDISYDEVNPVDVEVLIPDLTERRTPIAKLFNDTSPPLAKSPSPPMRMMSPHPNVFIPIEQLGPHLRKPLYPSPKILRKVAMFEGLHLVDSRRRPVSPGPESKYLGSVENLADPGGESHDCECATHPGKLTRQSRSWVSTDSGLYDGTLKPVSARKTPEMFQPTWRKTSPDPVEERPRSTSPYCQSFSDAAFGVNGNYVDNHVPDSVRHPSRARNLSSDSNRENKMVQSSIGSQTNTHVDRLARSGSAASLAVVMASTFPNGGDPNFDLAGTAAKISQVCKSLSNSQSDVTSCGVNLTRSRSVNSGIDVIHNSEAKRSSRPLYFNRSNTSTGIRLRTTPENRVGQPMKAKKATATYREVLKLQEKLKDAEVISYQDLVRCPRNKLPAHVDKLQLQKYLSDTEFVDVLKMPKEEFNKLAPWKQATLKKNVSLY